MSEIKVTQTIGSKPKQRRTPCGFVLGRIGKSRVHKDTPELRSDSEGSASDRR
ncbi:MAG: uL30 family ribosomal protein [Microthrixaceae bacterium]